MTTPINTYDGNLIVNLIDASLNTTASSLKLPGRGYLGYGEVVLDDIVWLMTNFARNSAPSYPIKGQIWYDTSTRQLKLYDPDIYGSNWQVVAPLGSPIGADPVNPAAPTYTAITGVQLTDTSSTDHSALLITIGDHIVGVYSGDSVYQPNVSLTGSTIPGITNVYPGFNSLGISNSTVSASQGLFDRVRLTGNIVVGTPENGDIEFDGAKFKFSFPNTSGNIERFTPVFSEQFVANGIIYVGTNGSDVQEDNSVTIGTGQNSPFRTLRAALASPLVNSGNATTILVSSGTYIESNPLYVPPNTSIVAVDPKFTVVQPLYPNIDVFHLDTGTSIEGIQVHGVASGSILNSNAAPGGVGYAAAFSFPRSIANTYVSGGNLVIGSSPSAGGNGYLYSYTGYAGGPGTTNNVFVEPNSIGSNATVTGTLVNGAITEIVVTNPGSGYTPGSSPTVTITGPGTGAVAKAIVTLDGKIGAIQVTDPGQSYGNNTSLVTVTIAPPTSGTQATAIIPNPPVLNGNVYYASNTTTFINGVQQTGQILCTKSGLNDGVLRSYTITPTAGNSNYSSPPIVSIPTPLALDGGLTLSDQPQIKNCTVISGPFDINGVFIPEPGQPGLYGAGPSLPWPSPTTPGGGYATLNPVGAGIGLLVDAQLLNPSAIFKGITVENFDAYLLGGSGLVVINTGLAEVDALTTAFNNLALSARSGGKIIASSMVVNDGNAGMQSTGFYPIPYTSGAIAADVMNGLSTVYLTSGGSGYLSGGNGTFPVTFSGGGLYGNTPTNPASGYAYVVNGVVQSVAITTPGSGYVTNATAIFSAQTGTTQASGYGVIYSTGNVLVNGVTISPRFSSAIVTNTGAIFRISQVTPSGSPNSYYLNTSPPLNFASAGQLVNFYDSSYIIADASMSRVGSGVTLNALPQYNVTQIPNNELLGGLTTGYGITDPGKLFTTSVNNFGEYYFGNKDLVVGSLTNSTVINSALTINNVTEINAPVVVSNALFANSIISESYINSSVSISNVFMAESSAGYTFSGSTGYYYMDASNAAVKTPVGGSFTVSDVNNTLVQALVGTATNPNAAVNLSQLTNLIKNLGIVGEVRDFAGSTAPDGWLFPYGQAVSRTTYSALFAVIGTIYGPGDGSTTFNLPDYRGRVSAGVDNMGGTAANRVTSGVSGISGTTLSATGGNQYSQSHSHGVNDNGHSHGVNDPTHNHGVNDPSHAHTIISGQLRIGNAQTGSTGGYYSTAGDAPGGSTVSVDANTTGISIQSAYTGISIQTGYTGVSIQTYGSGNSQNMQPTIMINKIIFTGVF